MAKGKHASSLNGSARRQRAQSERDARRHKERERRRNAGGGGGVYGASRAAGGLAAPPLLVCCTALGDRGDAERALGRMREAAGKLDGGDAGMKTGDEYFVARRYKRRIATLPPLAADDAVADPLAFLDIVKLADVVVLVDAPGAGDGDAFAPPPALAEAFRLMRAVGVPHAVGASLVPPPPTTMDTPNAAKLQRRHEANLQTRRKAFAAHLASSGLATGSEDARVFEFHGTHDAKAAAAHDAALRHLSAIDAAAASRSLKASTNTKTFGSAAQVAAATLKAGVPQWRRHRAYLVADTTTVDADTNDVTLTGYLRGCADVALSCLQLVHVSGLGDLVPTAIAAAPDPCAASTAAPASGQTLLARRPADGDERVEALAPFASGDDTDSDAEARARPMDLEAEMAAAAGTRVRRKVRVPKGTGDYQAAWYDFGSDDDGPDDDDDFSEGSEEVEVGRPDLGDVSRPSQAAAAAAAADAADAADGDDDMEGDMEEDAEAAGDYSALAKIRAQRTQHLDDDLQYPDEVDHAPDADGITGLSAPFLPARQRFRKYRALASLRSSSWIEADVDIEERPRRYSRIYRLDEPRRSWRHALYVSRQHRLAADAEAGGRVGEPATGVGASLGLYVSVTLAGAPREACERLVALGLATARGASAPAPPPEGVLRPPVHLIGLLEHEAKHSVLHFSARRYTAGAADPPAHRDARSSRVYKSGGDAWLLYTPVRTIRARCVYSGDAMPTSAGEARRHKVDRYLRPAGSTDTAVFTAYGPIYQGVMPFVGFVRNGDASSDVGSVSVVAVVNGTVRGADPDALLLKRAVLTGWPLRVHKKTATVRFMFHNPEDVRYFMPAEFWSKGGGHRRGKIAEPLGTHGGMKMKFDGPIRQSDAVCLSLYKRQYPKDDEWQGYVSGWRLTADV